MKTIWKFQLRLTDLQIVSMPKGAEILTVQVQHGIITMWAKVNTDAELVRVPIQIVGTGNPYQSVGKYIGTVQLDGFVWHLFQEDV
jgi:hypothetical protein